MSRMFVYPRPRPRGLVGRGQEAYEQVVLLGAAVVALLLVWLLPGWPLRVVGAVAALGAGVWAVFAPYQGRTYVRWFEIRATYRRTLRRRELLYRSGAPQAGVRGTGMPRRIRQPAGTPPLQWFAGSTAFGDLAVLLKPEPGDRMFLAAVEVESEQDFGGLDEEDRESLLSAYDHLLRQTAQTGRIKRLHTLLRVVPTDPHAHARDAAARRDPTAPAWLLDSYDEVQQMVAVTAEDRRLFLVVGVPYTHDVLIEARRHRTLAAGFGHVIGEELEAFIRNLPHGQLRFLRTLGEPELASLIHSLYDPTHLIDETLGMSQQTAWPAEIDGRDPSYLACRSWSNARPWYSATAWCKTLPVLPQRPNFLAPLLLWMPGIRTVSVIMDLEADTNRAIASTLADATVEEGQTPAAGRHDDPRNARERSSVRRTLDELADGGVSTVVTCYVTVTAPTPEALERARSEARNAAGRAGIALEWLEREHWRAFATTLPLATGLLQEGWG